MEEIDKACFMGNFSSVRVMVARATAMGIPETEFLGNPRHGVSRRVLGSTFSIEVLRVWPRAEQMDDTGRLRPFFPRPPRDGGERGGPGWIAGPNLFGLVLHGSIVGFPGYGWGGLGPYYGYPVYYHQAFLSFLIHILRALIPLVYPSPAHITTAPPPPTSAVLILPWYDDEDDSPPAPPPTPVSSPIHATSSPPQPTRRRRCPRNLLPSRSSARLAEKEDGSFVPMSAKAIKHKAIRESLQACLAVLKKQIKGRHVLKRKHSLGALDLGRLARAAGLSCSERQAVTVAAASMVAL